MSVSNCRGADLSLRQALVVIALGVVLWFLGAVIISWAAPLGGLDGGWRLLTYALIIPGTLPFVFLVKWLARLRDDQVFAGIAAATGTAIACDSLAIPYFPIVYGTADLGDTGAVILWGGAVAIALGAMVNRPQSG